MDMKEFDLKKKELELVKLRAAKTELEFRIMEREIDISRILENLKIQEISIDKAQKELDELRK